ncbi:Cdc37 N terminal kinase binding-domain-containing protein [Entophlyctis helioformis]|nr:Cdc37 N terminal kinase binding-domain-containing protein [Entophlyctis helioformis]
MPIDYSKWDAIELSDDEDFECHPNVDKKSMVRWKQDQVHKERRERKDQFDLLSLELATTAKFLADFPAVVESRLASVASSAALIDALKGLQAEAEKTYTDPIRTESLGRINSWPQNWEAPDWGTVLREHVPWHDAVAGIADTVAKTALAAGTPGKEDVQALVKQTRDLFKESFDKFAKRQKIVEAQVKVLDNEMNKKLTIDHLKTGFDKTIMTKKDDDPSLTAAPAADAAAKPPSTIHTPKQTQTVATPSGKISAEIAKHEGLADEILDEFNATDSNLSEVHPQLIAYSRLSDFGDIVRLLHKHSDLQSDSCEESLLMRALGLEIIGNAKEAKNCVINSLVLKYTRSLGSNGVDVFFGKLEGGKSSAHTLFFSDVNKTYEHIQKRGIVLRGERIASRNKQNEERAAHEAKIREIYNTFLQPDGTLKFPLSDTPSEESLARAEWFNSLPQYAQEGLVLEDIDKINQFLTSIKPEEADRHAKFAIECGFIQVQDEEAEEDGEE